jgi:peptidoglycan/LPS O-acetylase OafA/YrhL
MAAILGLCISFREPRTAMVLFTTLTIYASAFTGGLQTWLSGRALRYLARISYSLYLVHMTVGVATIHLVMRFTQGSNTAVLAAFAAAIIVSILTADLLNRFVEAPALCLSKRLKGVGARETRSIGIFAAFARLSFRMPLRVEVN